MAKKRAAFDMTAHHQRRIRENREALKVTRSKTNQARLEQEIARSEAWLRENAK